MLGSLEGGGHMAQHTTFYILDCAEYHWILGLALLEKIDGAVFCKSRTLQFYTHPSAPNSTTIAL